MADETIPAPPSGSIVDAPPQSAAPAASSEAIPAPPSGSIVDTQPVAEDADASAKRSEAYKSKAWSDIINHIEARDLPSAYHSFTSLFNNPDEMVNPKENIIGAVKSAGQTVNTMSEGISKVLPSLVRPSDVAGLKKAELPATKSEESGAGLEQLAEFVGLEGGATALEGLSYAQKLSKLLPTMKLLENSPKMLKMVQAAYRVAKLSGVTAAVSGTHPEEGQTRGEAATAGAIGGAVLGVGAEALGAAGRSLPELIKKSLRPTIETVGETAVPVRSKTLPARAAFSLNPELAEKFATEQTGPAVAKGIGETAKAAVGTVGETTPVETDRMGILSHADEVKARSQTVFQKLDDLSNGELTKAQLKTADAASDYSAEGRKQYREGLKDQENIFEFYKTHPEFEGMDLDAAKKDWKQQTALRQINKTLTGATESSPTGETDYRFKQGKQLAESIDKILKNDKDLFHRAGFSDTHIDQLQEFGRIIREEGTKPKFPNYVSGIARVLSLGTGFHFGGVGGALLTGGAEAAAEKAGTWMVNRMLGKMLTDTSSTEALKLFTEGLKNGTSPEIVAEQLKASLTKSDPSWADKMGEAAKKLWNDETGEFTVPGTGGAPKAANTEYNYNKDYAETNNAHTVTTTDAEGNKIGELTAQDTGNVKNGEVTVRSNQVYNKADRGKGLGQSHILKLIDNVGPEVKTIKSDISTTVDAQRAWKSLEQKYPDAITSKTVGKGESAKTVWSVDADAMRAKSATAKAASEAHNAGGGMTFNPIQGNMNGKAAYAVAGSYPELSKVIDGTTLTPEMYRDFVTDPKVAKVLKDNPNASVGSWAHDGKIDLEISETPADLEEAKALGTKNKQIAIYDLKSGKDIQLGGPGTRPSSNRVGQRLPSAVDSDMSHNPETNLPGTLDKVMAENPKYAQKLADKLAGYDTLKIQPVGAEGTSFNPEAMAQIDPQGTVKQATKQFADNIVAMHDMMPKDIRETAKNWYDSAHTMTKQQAEEFGISHPQSAAVTAVLSPQNPWDNNISLTNRVLDIWKNKQDFKWSPEMNRKAAELYGQSDAIAKFTDMVRGKTFAQLTDADPEVALMKKAMWTRLYDEAHNPSTFERWAPDGTTKGLARNANGQPSKSSWFSLEPIAKAISILEDGSMENINLRLGKAHKVRNFYNNIVDPNAKMGDTTIDTHAVGVAHFSPFSGDDVEVKHNFRGSKNAANGLTGTYPVYHDAYRMAAEKLGLLPRELQSITWEGIRSLFKDKSPELTSTVRNIWKEHQNGDITISEARKRIVKAAGGFKPAEWQSDYSSNEAAGPSTNAAGVSGTGLSKEESQVNSRARSGATGAVPTARTRAEAVYKLVKNVKK
jgi:hypothetical protein